MPKRVHRSAEAFTYVLMDDRKLPLAEQSRFRLKPLTQAEKLAVLDGLNWVDVREDGTSEVMPRAFQQALELVLTHLESTENFPSDGPEPWPGVSAPRAKRVAYLEMLDEMDVYELGNEIRHHAEPERAVETPNGEVTVPN